MPYAFSRTISDILSTFKRFHDFIFHRVRDGFISDLVSKWGVCFGVRESINTIVNVYQLMLSSNSVILHLKVN